MGVLDGVKAFYDQVFGNNDGRFDVKDLPNYAVLVVAVVVDLVMLVAEYRVGSVGYKLTNSYMLALGFVAVSSIPFYLGQVAFLYNRANNWQKWFAGALVGMGLFVSAYYGFADYILQTNSAITLANGVSLPMDVNSLYLLAVSCTVILIVIGLLYVLVDDQIANTLKQNRLKGRANTARQEMAIKTQLLQDFKKLREEEDELRRRYPDDFDALQAKLTKTNKPNPTQGNGNNQN